MKLSVFYDHILQAAVQTGKSPEELLKEVRSTGIEAVEINMTYLCEHEETYRLLEQAGLQVSCVYEFYEMDRRDESIKAKRHIETARKAGAGKILVVPGFLSAREAELYKATVPDYEKVAEFLSGNEKALRMVRGLSEIVMVGIASGVTVTIEDFDHVTSPISCMNGMLWFLKQIPQLRVTFDTGNFITHGEDLFAAWELLKDFVVHVHCKDREARPVAVGEGYIPIKNVVGLMKQNGYEGYLAIEHFDADNQEICMRKSADYLRDVCV